MPGEYSQTYPSFALFLNGERPVGNVVCSGERCEGRFLVPEDLGPGTYRVTLEGGSSMQLRVVLPQPPPPPPQDWREVQVAGQPGQRWFSLRLPPGWVFRELPGIDSYVGEIVGDGVRLGLDYGAFSDALEYDNDPDYEVTYEPIDRRRAKLVRPKEGKGGLTGVHFEDLGGPALTIAGFNLSPQQQQTAFAIFRSITSPAGLLRGRVTIGPLVPVERLGEPTPTPNPQLFAKRRVLVLHPGSNGLHKAVPIGADGYYQTWLRPGTYIVDIETQGIELSKDVPRQITIEDGGTTVVDISIDTGIR